MANYNFSKDLSVAKTTELEVASILERGYNINILDFGKTNSYDILGEIGGVTFTFEVKEDFMCEKTGNVCVEYSCRGKSSGIEVTEADFYIYKVHTKDNGIQYIIHNTDTLKRMIDEKLYFRMVNGGDKGSNSLSYLFKYDVFAQTGKFLDLDRIQ